MSLLTSVLSSFLIDDDVDHRMHPSPFCCIITGSTLHEARGQVSRLIVCADDGETELLRTSMCTE
jgi:hypothetical protein